MKPALDESLERWNSVSTLLEAVLEREPEQRARYLDEICRGEPALKSEVEKLLALFLGRGVVLWQ